MTRIIPGVTVDVVKEVVPPPANPSGIVGLIGITDRGPAQGARAGSWQQFIDIFGQASAYSLPEAKQLIENGAF
ncbi:MAG: phage tail sheath protein, partial [Myxococcota bacterium]